jgi:hypothetical protein
MTSERPLAAALELSRRVPGTDVSRQELWGKGCRVATLEPQDSFNMIRFTRNGAMEERPYRHDVRVGEILNRYTPEWYGPTVVIRQIVLPRDVGETGLVEAELWPGA